VRAALIRVGLAIAFCYALLLGGSWVGIYAVGVRVLTLVVVAGVLVGWAVACARHEDWRPRTSLYAAVIAVALSWSLSVPLSRFPRLSAEYAAWAVLLGVLYLLLVQLLRRPAMRRIFGFTALSVAATIEIAYLLRVGQLWIEWWSLLGHVDSPPLRPAFESLTFGNPSAVLTVSLLLWLGGCALLLPLGRRPAIVAVVIGIGVAAVAFVSGSRAGWLAIVVAAVPGALIWLALRRRAFVRYRRGVLVGGSVAFIVAGSVATLLLPSILARVNAGGEVLRSAYAAAAVRMFDASPIVGTGPGTWAVQRVLFTSATEPDYYVPHAHDAYVQALAEFGLVGAVAGLVAGFAIGRLIWRSLRGSNPVGRGEAVIAVITLVYFAAHNVLDSYANMPTALLAWVLPIAMLDARQLGEVPLASSEANRGARAAGRSGFLMNVGLAGIVAVCAVGLGVSERVAIIGADAAQSATTLDWSAAYHLGAEAAQGDPQMPVYQVTLGLAAAAEGRPSEAAAAFRNAAERDGLPETWLDLAAVDAQLGRNALAGADLTAALRLGRQQAPVALGAAVVYLQLKDPVSANDALAWSLIALPALAADSGWRAIAHDALGVNTAIQLAMNRGGGVVAWEIATMSGDPKGAADTRAFPNGYAPAELVTGILAGNRAALEGLVDYAIQHPTDQFAVDWAGRLAIEGGQQAIATRLRRIAEIATSETTVGYAVAVVWDGDGQASAGDRSTFYGPFAYRRLTPEDKLVTSLPSIEYR